MTKHLLGTIISTQAKSGDDVMKSCKYQVTATKKQNENGAAVTVYGITLADGENRVVFDDLCTDLTRIKHLCALLNELSPDPHTLPDIFCDFLY